MSPIQQMLLGVGAAKKTYVDDVFSTYVYKGTGSAVTVNNGIDLAGEGGMTWIKSRTSTNYHTLVDTVRGATKAVFSNHAMGEDTATNGYMTSFNNSGFTTGTYNNVTNNNQDLTSWTFRKAPGFFDVIKYGGSSNSTQSVAHNLGCVPGMIIVKNLNSSKDWAVYHRDFSANNSGDDSLKLNEANIGVGSQARFGNTLATATHFTAGPHNSCNKSSDEFIAYLFAGGESTAATARSVEFDGSGDSLSATPASGQNYQLSGDFTIECWVKPTNNTGEGVFAQSSIASWSSWGAKLTMNSGTFRLHTKAGGSEADRITGPQVKKNQWQHIALVRSGSTVTMYVDGLNEGSYSDSDLWGGSGSSAWFTIGAENYDGAANELTGSISNFRVTRGQALYTSSFRPSTEPLTTTSQGATSSNVIILACNNASVTGATVKDNISSNGDPTASSDSPFDDPAGFKFGDAGDQNVIKTGSYNGNGDGAGPEINLGWEPQWLLIKRSSGAEDWILHDCMRGIPTGGNNAELFASTSDSESDVDRFSLTSTGFKITTSSGIINNNGDTYIYMAIRRPDGYCGKPPELGTDVFAMDTGNGSTTIPAFDSGFPVDMNMNRKPASTWSWQLGTRLQGKDQLNPNTSDAEGGELAKYVWDSNAGFGADSGYDSSYQSWMWKRHAGFDVVTYKGDDAASKNIAHTLGKTPEMIWIKCRNDTAQWVCGHKGLNGGTNPWNYYVSLNQNIAESAFSGAFNDTAPTSTHFTVGTDNDVNDTDNYIAMLFASVKGISHCGTFTGNGSTQTITIPDGGFQPRFLIMKCTSHAVDWQVLDTTRGWGSGNDKYLELNTNAAQYTTIDFGAPTSTGFTLTENAGFNGSGREYIYYAHA